MANYTKKIIVGLFLVTQIVYLSSCFNHKEQTKERIAAEQLLEYIQESNKLANLEVYKTVANEERIEICFWGDCGLDEVFEAGERANSYLSDHKQSIILTGQLELSIVFFSEKPTSSDYNDYGYYACITKKTQEDFITILSVHSDKTIRLSSFRHCNIPLKEIVLPFNIVFDDYESLFKIQNIQVVELESSFVRTDGENLLYVLNSLCFYEDNDIELPFVFYLSVQDDLREMYNEFLLKHSEYDVFKTENKDVENIFMP